MGVAGRRAVTQRNVEVKVYGKMSSEQAGGAAVLTSPWLGRSDAELELEAGHSPRPAAHRPGKHGAMSSNP